jgi:hypothetical protein
MGLSRSSTGRISIGRWLLARMALFCAGAFFLSAASNDEAPREVRVRLEWRSEKAECWAGVLETSQGSITNAASLGVTGDEAGTLWADGKCLWLARRKASNRDGFEVTVIAPAAAHLSFTLRTPGQGGLHQGFECLLSDLEGECKSLSAKNPAVQLCVRRAPGDALRIVVDHPNLIYRPGETFKATLVPDVLATTHLRASARVKWWLADTKTGETRKQGFVPLGRKSAAARGAKGNIPIEIPLPLEEGAASLHFRLLGSGPSEPRSGVQLLVLGERSSRPAVSAPDTLVDRLDANDIELKRRLVSTSEGIPSFPHAVTFNAQASGSGEPAIMAEPQVDWNAVQLKVKHPQRPHRLVLHIAAGGGTFLGASLLEPDARGGLSPHSIDTALSTGREESNEWSTSHIPELRHEIVFWPRSCDPVLLLHDVALGRRTQVTSVEVFELAAPPRLAGATPRADERLMGPYISQPLLPENFGGPKIFDPIAGECVDDWESFHAAALHVADYLAYQGYNSLLIGALSNGRAIYPSTQIEPTRRYDTGAVSAVGPVPIGKDFLEVLYRVFDREGLVLIPELQFSCALPQLERQLVDGAAAEGIELIGADGQSAREIREPSQGAATYYNPLDPRVQDAVLAAVREVVARYRHHWSFRGVALEISRSSYLELAGLDWGYDSATVRRFEHDTGVCVDGSAGGDLYQHRHAVLTGEARAAWIRWRCQEMAKFYRRLAEVMGTAAPDAQLILACKQMLADPGTDEEIRHEIRARGRLGDALAIRGIDFSLIGDAPRLIVLKSTVWNASASAEEGLFDEALGQTGSFGAAFQFPRIGALNYRPPHHLKIGEFATVCPWQPAETRLAIEASPTPRESRRGFVRGLAETDAPMMFDGGWMVPLGQEYATESLRRIARAIPPIPFYKVEAGNQSAIVQTARHNKRTYIYAVNPFAEPFELTLRLSCPPGTACRPLGPSRSAFIDAAGDQGSQLKTSLEGYGLVAWELDHEDTRVNEVQTQISPAELALLRARVGRFQRQLAVARRNVQAEQGLVSTPVSPETTKAATAVNQQDVPAESGPLVLASGRRPSAGIGAEAQSDTEPLSADDLRQLAKISLQLALAADEQRIAECQWLLDGYWCRYLSLRSETSQQPALFREAARPVIPAAR